MTVDVDAVRADTPGIRTVAHLNNAGAALPPRVVTETVVRHLELEATIGGYEAAADTAEEHDAVYRSVADLLGASPPEIALVENATRAWDMAVYGFPFEPGDRVVTARSEYASNAIALLQLQRRHLGLHLVRGNGLEVAVHDLAYVPEALGHIVTLRRRGVGHRGHHVHQLLEALTVRR